MPLISSFVLLAILSSLFHTKIYASEYGKVECFSAAVVEAFVPGVGYLYTRQWDKVAVFGSTRWAAKIKMDELREQDDFQKEVLDLQGLKYKEKSDGKNPGRTHYFLNQSSMRYDAYRNFEYKMGWGTGWDIYAHDCQNDPEVYGVIASPFDIGHWYDNWMVWLGLAAVIYSASVGDEYLHLGNGATREEYLQGKALSSLVANGFGEETIFRGGLQKSVSDWSGNRHIGIWSTNIVFGLAHPQYDLSGQLSVTLIGAYLGYIYQPNDTEHDLKSAVALHDWWNFITAYYLARRYEERKEAFDSEKDGKELTRDFYAREARIQKPQEFQLINWTMSF